MLADPILIFARVLKPGGIGLIDEPYFSYQRNSNPSLKDLEGLLDVTTAIGIEGLHLGLLEKVDYLFGDIKPGEFLIIIKPPVGEALVEMIRKPRYRILRNILFFG